MMKKLLCCDWGSTNFRLYLVDTDTEKIIEQLKDSVGIAELFNRWKQTTKMDRIPFFRNFLQSKINELAQQLQINLKNIPVILSGMASSSIGIVEVPYQKLPFDIQQPNLNYHKITNTITFPNDIYIFGGLQSDEDVMRGEEVQIIGLKDSLPNDCICILPGTHSKHITIQNYQITTFQTFMTGEIFQLLSQHSILRNSIHSASSVNSFNPYFEKGVLKAAEYPFLNALFSVRTNDILKNITPADNLAYLSGLVIGSELKALRDFDGALVLAGGAELMELYFRALAVLRLDKKLIPIPNDIYLNAIIKTHLFLFKTIF